MSKCLADLASVINAELIGEPQCEITAVSPLNSATKGCVSFISDMKYVELVESSNASALIVSPTLVETLSEGFSGNLLVMDDPYLGYAKLAQVFDNSPVPAIGIHPTCSIGDNVKLGHNISLGAGAVIADNVTIGDNTIIEAGAVISLNCAIGSNCRIYPNSVLYHSVEVGDNCILHANTVIGSDGFGYANEKGRWVKIPQVGSVIIKNDVEIGAHTAIDRGALENTVIGQGVIIDNHVHIAHNVKIGDFTAIAGCTAIAGSTSIGKYCTIAGRVSIIGHLTIGDKVHITATTFVNKSIKEPGAYSSGTTFQKNKDWHKSNVRYRNLDDMWRKVKALEKELAKLKKLREDDDE